MDLPDLTGLLVELKEIIIDHVSPAGHPFISGWLWHVWFGTPCHKSSYSNVDVFSQAGI